MDIKTYLGQKFIIGFNGKDIHELSKIYKEFPCGGVALFERNYENKEQLKRLINEIKNLNQEVGLFIAVDHEGGSVQRFKKDFTLIPSPKKIGDLFTNSGRRPIEKIFKGMAEELLEVGINCNFAPLYDINTNPDNPIIGKRERAFSSDPHIVAKLGNLEMDVFSKASLIPCAKHFPGHGDTNTDSHLTLPVVGQVLEELRDRELIPFVAAIKNNIPLIMTAHVLCKNIDDEYPATISKRIIKDLLRNELNYKGVVITDALEMKGISEGYSPEEIVELGVRATSDIFLFGELGDSYERSFKRLMKLYAKNSLWKKAIDTSVLRILKLKEDFL